jgi:hypothetical protein
MLVSADTVLSAGGDLTITAGSNASIYIGDDFGYSVGAYVYYDSASARAELTGGVDLSAGGSLSIDASNGIFISIGDDLGSYAAASGYGVAATASALVDGEIGLSAGSGNVALAAGGSMGIFIGGGLGYQVEAGAWGTSNQMSTEVSGVIDIDAGGNVALTAGNGIDISIGSNLGYRASAGTSGGSGAGEAHMSVVGAIDVDAGGALNIGASSNIFIGNNGQIGNQAWAGANESGGVATGYVGATIDLRANSTVNIDGSGDVFIGQGAGVASGATAWGYGSSAMVDMEIDSLVNVQAGQNLNITGDRVDVAVGANAAYNIDADASADGAMTDLRVSVDTSLRAGQDLNITGISGSIYVGSQFAGQNSADASAVGAIATTTVTGGVTLDANRDMNLSFASDLYAFVGDNFGGNADAIATALDASATMSVDGGVTLDASRNLNIVAGNDAQFWTSGGGVNSAATATNGATASLSIDGAVVVNANAAMTIDAGRGVWVGAGNGGSISAFAQSASDTANASGNFNTTLSTRTGDISIAAGSWASFQVYGSGAFAGTSGGGVATASESHNADVDAGGRLFIEAGGASSSGWINASSDGSVGPTLSGTAVSFIANGGAISLTDAALSVGSANVPGGDLLAGSFGAGNLSALFSGSSVQLGDFNMTGSYMRINADTATVSSSATVSIGSGGLVQWAPSTGASGSGNAHLGQAEYDTLFSAFGSGITAMFGSNDRIGDITYGSSSGGLDASGNVLVAATAGGDITGAGSLNAAEVSLIAGGNVDISSQVITVDTNFGVIAGSDILLTDITMNADTVTLVAGGSILNGGATGYITAEALAALAGGDIILDDTILMIGNGTLPGVDGDVEMLRVLGLVDVAPRAAAPNASFVAGGEVVLGDLTLSGTYLAIESNLITFDGTVTVPTGSLVQFTPFGESNTIGFDFNNDTSIADSTYSYNDFFADLGTITIAIGHSEHLGDVFIGQSETASPDGINIVDSNFICATQGVCYGIETIASTGLVGTLRGLTLVGFDTPQVAEVDPTDRSEVSTTVEENELDPSDDDDEDSEEDATADGEDGGESSSGGTLINQRSTSDDSDSAGVCGG